MINQDLAANVITVPSNVFGIFMLSNLTISYYDNFIYLGFTPTFIPRALAVEEKLAIFQ